MQRRKLLASTVSSSAALVSGCTGILSDDDDNELTIGSFTEEDDVLIQASTTVFVETLNEQLDDREFSLDIQGSEAVGGAGELYDLAADGVVDIGNDLPAYQGGRMPLNNIMQFPLWPAQPLVEETTAANEAYYELATPGGDGTDALYQEFADLDVRPIMAFSNPPYQLITDDIEVQEVSDTEGLNLRSAGPAKSAIGEALGMSPQRIAAPDMYTAHQQGTVDADILSADAAFDSNLQEVTNYITDNLNLGGFGIAFVVGDSTWESFDSTVQDAMIEAGREASVNYIEEYMEMVEDSVLDTDLLVNESDVDSGFEPEGDQMYQYSTNAAEEINDLMEGVVDDWVAEQESEGLPAEQVVDDFNQLREEFR